MCECRKMTRSADFEWMLWQLVDSAFPTGTLNHSSGLEACHIFGLVSREDDFGVFCRASLENLASAALPFAREIYLNPSCEKFRALDQHYEAFSCSNAVANQASRHQGLTYLSTALASFPWMHNHAVLHSLKKAILQTSFLDKNDDQESRDAVYGHLPIVFGMCIASILKSVQDDKSKDRKRREWTSGDDNENGKNNDDSNNSNNKNNNACDDDEEEEEDDDDDPGNLDDVLRLNLRSVERMFLFCGLRAVTSAGVRLGCVGTLQAQRLTGSFGPFVDALLEEYSHQSIDDACMTYPMMDVAQGAHSRIYSKLFTS